MESLKPKSNKTKLEILLINSLCGTKANEPFSGKSWPGTLWKLKLSILKPQESKNEYEPEKLPKPAPGQRGDPYPKTAPNN